MEKSKILFRVDGNAQTGLGHLVRCIALAQMLKDRFEIIFVSRDIPLTIIDELKINKFNLYQIDNELSFFEKISRDDIVVLDDYHFDLEYQKRIKSTDARLVCVDDLHDREFVADLIINPAPGVFSCNYKALDHTQFALGLDYALLRTSFLQQAKKPQTIRGADTVFICFGGSDPRNLTKQIVEVILNAKPFKKVIVVTGAAYGFESSIKELININPAIEYHNAIGEAEMLTLMLRADLAIVPASGILLETMAVGCKIISGYYVDNQKILYERLRSAGAFTAAGNFTKDEFESAIHECLKSEKQALKLINGQSDKNILYGFYNILASLRKAEDSDCELIYQWANESTVRANAFNSKFIDFEEHKTWFYGKLKEEHCFIFVLSVDKVDIGQIRFDVLDGSATISYLIDKNYRGLGLGRLIVKKGIDIMNKENKVHFFRALVKPLNSASIKVFQRLNFVQNVENHQNYGKIYTFNLEL